jgi:hypothetical protein
MKLEYCQKLKYLPSKNFNEGEKLDELSCKIMKNSDLIKFSFVAVAFL